LAYVLLDGFDLGIGILFLVEHEEEDRDVMVNTVAPVGTGTKGLGTGFEGRLIPGFHHAALRAR
jgi:hypothetical protein